MKAVADMTLDEVLAESRRRDDRRARGLPLSETPAELDTRIAEDDQRLEKQIQADVVKAYRAHGCIVYSLSQPRATKQTPGIGDLYVLWPEMHFEGPATWWHETKTPTGRASPDQVEFREYCDRCGEGYVIGGLAAAEAKLREIGAIR
jgi:hypothetical protein